MEKFRDTFHLNFIEEDRWRYIADGLVVTLQITFFALILGIIIGTLIVGIIRTTYEKTHKLKVLNFCTIYLLNLIRGTPVVVQLLIMYFVIFGNSRIDKVPVAVLAFGINSGAYVAEIFRSGINSVETGQMEAGKESWV